MPDVTLDVQDITRAGLEPEYESPLSAVDTYKVPNNGRVFLHAKKAGAGDCTITIVTPGKVDGLAITDRTATVPELTGDVMIGPFPPAIYNGSDGMLSVTLSEVTGLSIAALRI